MKIKLFILIIIFTSCSQVTLIKLTHGNESNWNEVKKQDVPDMVISAFVSKYNNAEVIRYYKIGKNKYVIRFVCNKVNSLAVFSSLGISEDERLDEQDEYYFDEDIEYWDYDNYE